MSISRFTLFSLSVFAFGLFFLMPFVDMAAWADSSTSLGTGAKHVAKQISTVPKLIAVICYVIGTYFAVRSLLALRGFIENSDENPITRFLAFGITSALLISLPYIIQLTRETLNANYGSGTSITSSSSSFSNTGG